MGQKSRRNYEEVIVELTGAEKAINLAYEFWSRSVKPVKREKPHDYMRELLGRMIYSDFTDLQKWEDRKIKEWTEQGRLTAEGRLLTHEQKNQRVHNSGGSI